MLYYNYNFQKRFFTKMGSCRKRVKMDNVCCGDNCTTQGFCFDENNTNTPRSQDL
jgi:hypothetical protein